MITLQVSNKLTQLYQDSKYCKFVAKTINRECITK